MFELDSKFIDLEEYIDALLMNHKEEEENDEAQDISPYQPLYFD